MTNSHFQLLFLLQLVSCAFMTGVIWIVQILHYPAFAAVHEPRFLQFHDQHSKRITFIVGPLMLLELSTGLLLAAFQPSRWEFVANAALIAVIWLCTFFLSVPLHNRLGEKRDLEKIKRLVVTNWPRTITWSLRTVLLFAYAVRQLA